MPLYKIVYESFVLANNFDEAGKDFVKKLKGDWTIIPVYVYKDGKCMGTRIVEVDENERAVL